MITIIGGTGFLGGAICAALASSGQRTRAIVRKTSAPERVASLRGLGVELVEADLRDPGSLPRAFEGSDTVISGASATMSRTPGDSIESVDLDGQLNAVKAAEAAGCGHFVFVSFHPMPVEFPLQSAKRAVEARLRESKKMSHTILQPTFFSDVWLSPQMGFDRQKRRATVYGSGNGRINWISVNDVARLVAGAVKNPNAANATFELGGPQPLSIPEVAQRLRGSGEAFALDFVPEEALRSQLAGARSPLEKSFAALVLSLAQGHQIDPVPAARVLGVPELESVDQWAARTHSVAAM
jgi:uncharacterized protein YbjT (DUF2867 family)